MNLKESHHHAKRQFEHHVDTCKLCGEYDGSTGSLGKLCLAGTHLFIAMKEARGKLPMRAQHVA